MAIAGSDHNQHTPRLHRDADGVSLIDRWTLSGTSPCCACTRGGRAIR